VALHDFGAGSVLEIEPTVGDSLMVPFTDRAVPAVDFAAARVTVAADALDQARHADKGGRARRG
jgi:16S rRNA processing protein RimM